MILYASEAFPLHGKHLEASVVLCAAPLVCVAHDKNVDMFEPECVLLMHRSP